MLSTSDERSSGDASVRPQIEFAPTVSRPLNGGASHIYSFPNGWSASVVQHDFSYGSDEGLWELAVGTFDVDTGSFALDYSTPITDDVLGSLTDDDVAATLVLVAALPVRAA